MQLHKVVKEAKEVEELCTDSERQASRVAEKLLCKTLDKKFGKYITSSEASERFVDDTMNVLFDMLDEHINGKKVGSKNAKRYNQIENFSKEVESLEDKIVKAKWVLSNYSYVEKQQILRQLHLDSLPSVVDRIISENAAVDLK